MRRDRAATWLMTAAAMLVLLVQDGVLPVCRRLAGWRVLLPLRRRIARLPVWAALLLFLVPELCSRAGTVLSAWLLLQGDGWNALAVYAGAKLFAGATALWIYTACKPTLLRVRGFEAVHSGLRVLRQAALDRVQARLPPSGRFAAILGQRRARKPCPAVPLRSRSEPGKSQ